MSRDDNFVPVVDLFAGPGGLGEGFDSFIDLNGRSRFHVSLSIEKDYFAHQTLELRCFFRQFKGRDVPDAYYSYLRGEITRKELFSRYPNVASRASQEAWLAELGSRSCPSRKVDGRIKRVLKGKRAWVLIGGPPCQAYSMIGRARMKSVNPRKFEKDKRHYLYREFLRILTKHLPPVFVLENVEGILSSRIKGEKLFERLLDDLRNPLHASIRRNPSRTHLKKVYQYKIWSFVEQTDSPDNLPATAFVVKAEKYGIPQSRHRVVLLGIRKDLDIIPKLLQAANKIVSVSDVIQDLPHIRSGLSREADSTEAWQQVLRDIQSSKWIKDKRMISSGLRRLIKANVAKVNGYRCVCQEFVKAQKKPRTFADWYCNERLGGVCNHTSRFHMRSDLHRYFFAASFGELYGRTPKMNEWPRALLPRHQNIRKAVSKEIFDDRFRVQVAFQPACTITAHMRKDGHYFIHPDPLQCRSLTVREAARIQTFPDDYFFEGPRTHQYVQVGNAVPPLLARQLAAVVHLALKESGLTQG